MALSIRREKLEDTKDLKDQYQYRLIVRTSEVCVCVFMCLYADHGGFQSESVNYSTAFSFSRPTCDTCPHYNLPSVPSPLCYPSSALCQWKIPPAQSKHIKAKPNTGCSHSQLLLLFDGSDTHDVVNDGLMIVEN